MNSWRKIGSYLDREVRSLTPTGPIVLSRGDGLSSSVVLVHFHALATASEARYWIDSLVNQEPLAIVVAGKDSATGFDHLLRSLAKIRQDKHVMTGVANDDDPLEIATQFLTATWPVEERFDEWKAYSLVSVGSAGLVPSPVEQAIRALVGEVP